jgi:hypothetical protein
MKTLGRCVLGTLFVMGGGGGLLLGTQAAGAAPSSTPSPSTPAPTVTSDDGSQQLTTAGGGQDELYVQGTNFDDVTAIDFGGVPGTDVECSGGDLCSVIAPPRATAGTVFVTVTAAGGTSAIYNGIGDEITYYYPTNMSATPALLSLSPLHLGLFTLTATVTGNHGVPVSGLTVDFSEGTDQLCVTTTNSAGVATCSALLNGVLPIILGQGYVASTAGSATQLPAATVEGIYSL